MVKKKKFAASENKNNSSTEKEYKKLTNKVESDLKKESKNNDVNLTKETKKPKFKGTNKKERKEPKEKKKSSNNKSIKDMTRDELIKSAISTAQHANKTLRDYEKADKGHLYTHGKLLEIAERHDIKTKGNRVSRSFKNLSDNQLRDFIIEARQTYTGKSVKAVESEFDRRRKITTEMLRTRFPDTDMTKVAELSDSQFEEFFSRLSASRKSEGKNFNSNEIIVSILKDLNLIDEGKEDEYALAFQKQIESNERLNRNKAVNRNRGRKR